jgi:peptidoglycan/LPS O-acetylase OafA/YrhL/lysophospholipase L1-like esterase
MSSSVKSSGSSAELALTHPKYRPDIDGLRAVAVLSVVIYHAFPDALKAGFMGVDIFFVISGYLISSIIFENIDRGSFSFGQFYGRRIKRIFPALTLVLLSCLVFGWFGLLGDEFKQLGKHMAAGAGFVSNFFLWQESGYFNNAAETKPLLHLWSLAIEEQFYIVWPLVVWLTWKRKWLFLSVFIGLGVASFAYNVHLVRLDPTATFFSPATRIWELLAGVLLAYMKVRPTAWQPSQRQLHVASTLGVALLAFGLYRIDKGRPYPGTWALLPILGSFCLIFAGPTAWFNRLVLSNRLLVWVGLISFPLYLWHWPMLSFMRIVESEAPSLGYRVLAVALSVLLAWMAYYFIEKPIRANGKSTLKIAVLTTCVAALGLAGFVVFQNNGVTTRAAAQINSVNTWDNLTFATPCKFITNGPNHDDWCNIGNAPDKPPTTVLIGDSVGNGFSPMLLSYANESSTPSDAPFVFRQFGRGACPMLSGVGSIKCTELTAAATSYIDKTPTVNTVIFAANWPLYFYGFDWPDKNFITSAQFEETFRQTVTDYQKKGKRVIVFLAPPTGANPRACVVRPLRLTNQNNCQFNLQDAMNNSRSYRAAFVALLDQLNVDYFDPFKYMCDATSCKVADGTRIYYLDYEHFSAFGGQFLANAAKVDLRTLLKTTTK